VLKHLTQSDISAIIAAAERNVAAHPSPERGITLEEGLEMVGRPDPTYEALKQTIRALSQNARLELMALMWFGRGDEPGETFAELLAEAKRNSDSHDVDYIAEKSLALPSYLRDGLRRLRPN
jgi:hypothetical protein